MSSSDWLNALICAVDVGVHAVDERGITVYYNAQAGRLDGLDPHEVIGKHVLEVFPSLTGESSTLLRVLRSQETISHRRQSYRNYRGNEVHTTNTTRPVYAGDHLIGALEVATDITEVQHLAERVVDLQAASLGTPLQKKIKTVEKKTVNWTLGDIVTASPVVQSVIARAYKVARTSSPVLVYGETGVGKELLVQGIHGASPRAQAPFIAQNCAALPGALLEGILFGTLKGSFTGAENRQGLFELADGGTLFLDELNSMPLELQAKLLRVLEDGLIRRLGGQQVTPVDVRIIAAMNVDPEWALSQGVLREDLFYRIQVVALRMPALAERREDIERLVEQFVAEFNHRFGTHVRGVTPPVLALLQQAHWRGNIRELKHIIEAAMNETEGEWILEDDLPQQIKGKLCMDAPLAREPHDRATFVNTSLDRNLPDGKSLPERLSENERAWIVEELSRANGNIALTAERLGIPRQTLQSKLKKMGIK